MKNYYEMGALIRGEFRSYLKQLQFKSNNLSWVEDKHFFDSIFYVEGDTITLLELNRWCDYVIGV